MASITGLATEDRLDIMDLYARYAWAMDSADADTFVECYVPGGQLLDSHGVTEGEEPLRAWLALFLGDSAFPGSQHFYTQWRMQADGPDAATCNVYVVRMYQVPRTRHSQPIWQGYYTDDVRKVDGRWGFWRKRIHQAWELFGTPPDALKSDAAPPHVDRLFHHGVSLR